MEARANAFARECSIPESVLLHYTSQIGIKWDRLSKRELALLVAGIHVEKETVLGAALDYGLIDASLRSQYSAMDCAAEIRSASPHSLSTREYLKSNGVERSPLWRAENRRVEIGLRRLRLPVGMVQRVIEAINEQEISVAKGAELLLMNRYAFVERFGPVLHESSLP